MHPNDQNRAPIPHPKRGFPCIPAVPSRYPGPDTSPITQTAPGFVPLARGYPLIPVSPPTNPARATSASQKTAPASPGQMRGPFALPSLMKEVILRQHVRWRMPDGFMKRSPPASNHLPGLSPRGLVPHETDDFTRLPARLSSLFYQLFLGSACRVETTTAKSRPGAHCEPSVQVRFRHAGSFRMKPMASRACPRGFPPFSTNCSPDPHAGLKPPQPKATPARSTNHRMKAKFPAPQAAGISNHTCRNIC